MYCTYKDLNPADALYAHVTNMEVDIKRNLISVTAFNTILIFLKHVIFWELTCLVY